MHAIRTGRITRQQDGTIDPEQADEEWAAKTRPTHIISQADAAAAPTELSRSAVDEPDPELDDNLSYINARRAREILTGRLLLEKLKRQRGEVVDRAAAESFVRNLARQERDSWLVWPSRISASMAAKLRVDPHTLEALLEEGVRQNLFELPQLEVSLGG